MFRKLPLLLTGVLCFSFSAYPQTDPFTGIIERAEALFKQAKGTLDAAITAFEADSAAAARIADGTAETEHATHIPPVHPVHPEPVHAPVAVAEAVPVDSAAVDTAAAEPPAPAPAEPPAVTPPEPVKKAEKPPVPPKPPKLYPIAKPDIEMVFVKGGKFKMGCPDESSECTADERPRHEVKINNFLIGKYPVTQKQWGSVMGVSPAHFDGDDLPVESVSWNEVQEFIRRLNVMTGKKFRLPTEAEWEYAAQGGAESKGAKFAGHQFLDDIAWYEYNSNGTVQPVGKKKPNEIGLHDVAGNVWEWVGDRYDRTYYKEAPLSNPQGPKYGGERVYRGGAFSSDEKHCRMSLRNFNKPEYRAITLGFRLACAP
jgi:formylglycine-generating enzyme required for sulfatase activity